VKKYTITADICRAALTRDCIEILSMCPNVPCYFDDNCNIINRAVLIQILYMYISKLVAVTSHNVFENFSERMI